MSITTSAKFNLDSVQAALPAGAACSTIGGDPASTATKTVTFYGTDDATGQTALNTAVGQFVDRTANQADVRAQLQAALVANHNDITQDQTIQTQAATITPASITNLNTAAIAIGKLAQAVGIQAGNDINAKRELQALVREALQDFTSSDTP